MTTELHCPAIVVGGGPAGLMAADVMSAQGMGVHVFDAMPSVGRKFLLAGIGGLNLTHAEPLDAFVQRYGPQAHTCALWLDALSPHAVRDWAHNLGIATFVGSSQRVFPTDMKAAPLLRAWLHRMRHAPTPVQFHMRHRWTGHWDRTPDGWRLGFDSPQGHVQVHAQAVVLALGGGSWAKLGSDGRWVLPLQTQGIEIAPLQPANCGFDVVVNGRPGWSPFLSSGFAGQPLKSVRLSLHPGLFDQLGECVLTQTGLEGSLVYAASRLLRDQIAAHGSVTVHLNLKPALQTEQIETELQRPRQGKTLSTYLKARLGLNKLHIALLHELLDKATLNDPAALARAIGHLPVTLARPRPLDEAISTAGGVRLEELTDTLMLHKLPGVFCTGEMLDWEAPTGGYLLTACLASGKVAGQGVKAWIDSSTTGDPWHKKSNRNSSSATPPSSRD
jgi:uncharacterized flavoprotein (TIGR03862 family)